MTGNRPIKSFVCAFAACSTYRPAHSDQESDVKFQHRQTKRKKLESKLLSNVQTFDNVEVSIGFDAANVVQQSTPSGNHSQQTTTRRKIFLVRSHVFGQVVDACRQYRDLNVRRTGITIATLELTN